MNKNNQEDNGYNSEDVNTISIQTTNRKECNNINKIKMKQNYHKEQRIHTTTHNVKYIHNPIK